MGNTKEGIILADIIDTIDTNHISSLNDLTLLYTLEQNELAIQAIAQNVIFISEYLSRNKVGSSKQPSWLQQKREEEGVMVQPRLYVCGVRLA